MSYTAKLVSTMTLNDISEVSYSVVVNESKSREELLDIAYKLKDYTIKNIKEYDEYSVEFYAENEDVYNEYDILKDVKNKVTIKSNGVINEYELYGISLENLPTRNEFIITKHYHFGILNSDSSDYEMLYNKVLDDIKNEDGINVTKEEMLEAVSNVENYFMNRDIGYKTTLDDYIVAFESKI